MKHLKINRNVIKHVILMASTGIILSVACVNTTSRIHKTLSSGDVALFIESEDSTDQHDDSDIPLSITDSSLSIGAVIGRPRGLMKKITVSDWLMENGIMYSYSSIADKYRSPDIESFVRLYQNSPEYRWSLIKGVKKAIALSSFTVPVFNEDGIPLDFILLPIIESSYNPTVFSQKGAAGVWQFMPGTAASFGLSIAPHIDERRDPYKSAKAAATYLKKLYERFGDWSLVVAAYNVGEYKIQKLVDAYRSSHQQQDITFWDIKQGLPQETQKYVPRFFAIVKIVHNPQFYGFTEFDTMKVDVKSLRICKISSKTHLNVSDLADLAGLSLMAFLSYNPQFTSNRLPTDDTIVFYLPENSYTLFMENIAELTRTNGTDAVRLNPEGQHELSIRSRESFSSAIHRVQPGETVEEIAQNYGISVKELKYVNGLTSGNIYPGQVLIIPDERTAAR